MTLLILGLEVILASNLRREPIRIAVIAATAERVRAHELNQHQLLVPSQNVVITFGRKTWASPVMLLRLMALRDAWLVTIVTAIVSVIECKYSRLNGACFVDALFRFSHQLKSTLSSLSFQPDPQTNASDTCTYRDPSCRAMWRWHLGSSGRRSMRYVYWRRCMPRRIYLQQCMPMHSGHYAFNTQVSFRVSI